MKFEDKRDEQADIVFDKLKFVEGDYLRKVIFKSGADSTLEHFINSEEFNKLKTAIHLAKVHIPNDPKYIYAMDRLVIAIVEAFEAFKLKGTK